MCIFQTYNTDSLRTVILVTWDKKLTALYVSAVLLVLLTDLFKQHDFLQLPPAILFTLDCRVVVGVAAVVVLVVFTVVTSTSSAAINRGTERRQMLCCEKENQQSKFKHHKYKPPDLKSFFSSFSPKSQLQTPVPPFYNAIHWTIYWHLKGGKPLIFSMASYTVQF